MNGLTFGIRAVKKSLPFKPIRTKRAFEEVCDQIREEIQSGNLAPGDKLPSERELAEQFHVSRSTVREAFRTLEIGGVLELQKGVRGGAVVLMGNEERPITQTMADLLSLGGISLRDYTEARTCMQREMIRLACQRGTEEDFADMEDNLGRMRAAGPGISVEARTMLTQEFYETLAKATHNGAMVVIMRAFTEPLSFYLNKIGVDRTWDVATSREKFLAHLRARDVEAATAEMVGHMDRLHAYMLSKQ
ncbi:FadR family transcriptional regulator [Antarcticimicrobium luteum]|uniref:FadR family transcriptional regulator n=1 Tax=Antarcticimicrobium luteum TaxID=2547397 RepID=A0A4R5VGL7_9RHOB|nr:FadR family transcriptional regulator [Antarcticimicrobium luteum]